MNNIVKYNKFKKGSVLIISLWTLTFLTIFAVQIGLKVRQRVTLLSRIEDRSTLRLVAEAGIKKAVAILRQDIIRTNNMYTAQGKYYRHNNPDRFKNIRLNDGICNVEYMYFDDNFLNGHIRYGIVDEESKININIASRDVLRRLVYSLGILNNQDSNDLVEAIISWREVGETQLDGFYSDSYYSNLKYPYSPKNSPFEIIDELLLVKGISKELFNKIESFITIYGMGQININTASKKVLLSIGFSDAVADKILFVRRGADKIEATSDDYIFYKTHDIASDVSKFVELKEEEAREIDSINSLNMMTTNSYFYSIKSKASIKNNKQSIELRCVYDVKENIFKYYREK